MTNNIFCPSLMAGAVVILWGCSAEEQAAAPEPPVQEAAPAQTAIVIQGGTLIDGNGGAPVANSVVVIEGNRIAAVGIEGDVAVPDGAQIIDAAGKYVLPGLMDAKSNWYWNYGEAGLRWGMTSVFSSGGRNDTGMALRDAVDHKIIESPRVFQTYVAIRGRGPDGTGRDPYVPGEGNKMVASPEEAVEWVGHALEADADFITFGDGNGPPEIWAAGIEAAVAAA